MRIKNFIFKNPGLRIMALVLAIFVWAMITGKERAYSEKTFDINVEYFGLARNIDIRSINPDKVRVKIQGTSNVIDEIKPDDFKLRIDMKRITESTRIPVFTEDNLEYPPHIKILSIHPRMIEITTDEFFTRELPVKLHYTGKLAPGIQVMERRVVPEKVKVFGYKSQVMNLQFVETLEPINYSDIEETGFIKLQLKKGKEILKFEDSDMIEVYFLVENTDKDKDKNITEKK
jgi:YbbR domain-containing protein